MAVNQKERAYKAWPILAEAAKNKTRLTYGFLGDSINIHHRTVRFVLGEIQDYCLEEKLPPLTVLVVNKNTTMPGEGFIAWDIDDIQTALNEVYRFDWSQKRNPFSFASDGTTEEELVNHLVTMPDQSKDVYDRIKVRGVAQSIFRKALLLIYRVQCAFCGFSFPEALEAAHIIRWAEATQAQRMDPTNGLLLCSTHHKLFDSGLMTLNNTYDVIYNNPSNKKHYSESDIAMSITLHNQKALLPEWDKHYPALSYLEERHRIYALTSHYE